MNVRNRYYETDDTKYQDINWWASKEDHCLHLKKANKIRNITPQKIKQALQLQSDEYALHLAYKILDFRSQRRLRALQAKTDNKSKKKEELRRLLQIHKSKTRIADLMEISRNHLYRLMKEIELEDNNEETKLAITIMKSDMTNIKSGREFLRSGFSFNEIPNHIKGSFKRISSISKKLKISNQELLDMYSLYSLSYNIDKLHFSRLQGELDYIIRGLDLDYDLSSPEFWRNAQFAIFQMNELQNEITFYEIINEYKEKVRKKCNLSILKK